MSTLPQLNTALAAVLTASSAPTTLGATATAVQLIDSQVAAIHFEQYSGFPGADEMSAATRTMQAAAGGWPATKAAVVGAARLLVGSGPAVAALGTANAPSAAVLAQQVTAWRTGPLAQIVSAFAGSKTGFDNFYNALTKAYTQSAAANTDALNALQAQRIKLQIAEGQLQADEKSASSAGSIIASIFTAGIYGMVELKKLQDEINDLNNQARTLSSEQRAYAVSVGSFQNVLGATKQANLALDTVNTSLQQMVNSVDDITAQTSTNLTVMQAYLKMFQTEFANAVTQAQALANA